MLVIYSNENNPAALKLLVAKNYAGKTVELKLINASDRSIPRLLPYLKLDDDENIFIPNSAIWYLYPPSDAISDQVTEWLEWESRILAPNLAQTGLKNEKSKAIVVANLQKLNRSLENKTYLIENSATICDIAIFATLYPLYKDSTLSNDFLTGLTNITAYLKGLENQKPFKDAISEFKIDPKSAYQAFAAGAKYFSSAPSVTSEEQPQSPQHQASEVTNEELIAAAKSWKKSSKDLAKLKKIGKNVLPVKGEKNVFITSALPYVNNVPHLGNIIGCVLSADVFARYSRLCNNNTLYISGTDEYGTATETKALEEKLTCQAICDKYYKIHNEIYKWFNISFDHFGRTSTPQQTELCQEMFHTLNANGFMFTQSVEQLHCENCDRYLADRFVEGGCPNIGCTYEDARGDQCDGCGKLVNAIELKNPRCKICSQTPKLKSSHQYFIDLPQLEPLLHSWIKTSSPGWSHNAEVISKAWLKEGLKPRCITRDLKWGVPVPLDGYRQKVFYVWFDAPIGYMSISKAYTKDFKKWWKPEKDVDVKLYQFMAKDNVPFHAVLFPAMLLGANEGYVTVSHIMATEYLNYEDGKFSKSRGVGVFGTDARDTGIPSDVWRFYLLFVRPESQDSSFSWTDLATKNNSELLNNFGNFVNRALVFAKNNYDKTVPEMHLSKDDYTLLALCTREYKGYVAALEKAKLRDGIRHILAISKHGNQYMQANQPWVLLKGSDADKIKAGTVIGLCCNLSYLLAMLLQPYMPDTSANLLKQLNCAESIITPENVEIISFLPAGHKMGEPSPLFTKINLEVVEELKKKYAGQQQSESSSPLDVKSLEEAVAKQGEKVRNLKAAGGDKTLWQPEIAILLDLKKQLEAAKKSAPSADAKPVDVKSLEAAVTKQGEKLRALKASGAEKATWQPEVVILLDLKKQLEAAQKSQPAVPNGVPQAKVVVDVKSLEKKVEDQGLVVRKLKEGGAEKSVWQPEVEKLLALKKELTAATGIPTTKKPKKAKK